MTDLFYIIFTHVRMFYMHSFSIVQRFVHFNLIALHKIIYYYYIVLLFSTNVATFGNAKLTFRQYPAVYNNYSLSNRTISNDKYLNRSCDFYLIN